MKIRAKRIMALVAISLLGAGSVFGAITVSIEEAGADLLVSYSGSIDLTGLTLGASSFTPVNRMKASYPSINFGPNADTSHRRVDGPWSTPLTAFGTSSSLIYADEVAAGDNFGILANTLYLPSGYTSGTTISGSMTFNNTSYATFGISSDLNMTGVLNNGDTVTIQAVPEPATAGLLGLSGLLLFVIRRMQKAYGLR